MSDFKFVFSVCGKQEYIDSLHIALEHLRKFSKKEILVVTDPSRNMQPVQHVRVIEVTTPPSFTHGEAALFLKTSLYKYLPAGPLYCYLDTDVLALDNRVDEIFNHFTPPVAFAADHCGLSEFSPSAVHCGCTDRSLPKKNEFEQLGREYEKIQREYEEKHIPTDPVVYERYLNLVQIMAEYKKDTEWIKLPFLRVLLSQLMPWKYHFKKILKEKGDFRWDPAGRNAYDMHGNLLYDDAHPYPEYRKFIESKSPFRWDEQKKIWLDEEGNYLYRVRCNHLQEAIERKFGVAVSHSGWQHWNGGVFLFDHSASGFFDCWHRLTMNIFQDPYWKKRDQGTLAATAWKQGLANHPMLPSEFNFIADYGNEFMQFDGTGEFIRTDTGKQYRPHFVHVYHHFGDNSWEVWKWIERQRSVPG